jgi:cyclic pyranopterin phosphate synthase
MHLALPVLNNQPVRPTFAQGPRSLDAVKLLRISVTDRCNLRCLYCMPDDGMDYADRDEVLSAGDLSAVAAAARSVGVGHFKITGGEPTVRGDLPAIIERIRRLDPIDLSMTTNGLRLEHLAADLRQAGLDRLTISWDTMRPDRFARIARGGVRTAADGARQLETLRRGIDAAVNAGFERLKFNVVVIGGMNEDEVADFAQLTVDQQWTVRFIEYMPLGDATLADDGNLYTVDNETIRAKIERELGPLMPVDRQGEPGVGPANIYRLREAMGRVGFISAMSQPFCETCNRLRLTATGELRSCLFDGGEVSVLPALGEQADRQALIDMMRQCVAMKPQTHCARGNRAMNQLGG